MFEVQITNEARQLIEVAIAKELGSKAGLMIHRQGVTGDNSKTTEGNVNWQIQHSHPWAIQVGSYESISDDDENIVYVGGIRVWLPLIPRPNELGVIVSLKDGQLNVNAI